MSIYRNQSAKDSLASITSKLRNKLDCEAKEHFIETSFGKGFCLELGHKHLPRLVVIHGGYTNHSFILYYLRQLIGQYHIFALDLPGHPGRSSETILDPRDDSYGQWAVEMLDSLKIQSSHFLGLSYGGFVCQRVLALKASLVESLVLIVPAGICSMDQWSLIKNLMVPQMLFVMTKREKFLMHMMDQLFTDYDDEIIVDFFRDMLLYVKNDSRQMKISGKDEFKHLDLPVLLITAENDVVFDANKQACEAAKLFKNLSVVNLKGMKHSPSVTEKGRELVCDHINKFLLEKSINESETEAKRSY